jgi:hypothetical protein
LQTDQSVREIPPMNEAQPEPQPGIAQAPIQGDCFLK